MLNPICVVFEMAYKKYNRRIKYGKTFRCKKGKYKGRMVNYRYVGGKKSTKRLVLDKSFKRRRY